jgi:hypothetical protein
MSSIHGNKNKDKFLGMPWGTASNRLRKEILFNLLKKYHENVCYRCDKEIETSQELSIEHKKAWLNVDVKLFWDLDNIAFSHLICNVGDGRRQGKSPIKHGTFSGYAHYECRCDECTKANTEYRRKWRQETNKH